MLYFDINLVKTVFKERDGDGQCNTGWRGGLTGARVAPPLEGGEGPPERHCRLVWPTLVAAPPPSKSRESEVGNKEREGDDWIKENKGRENVSGGKEKSQRESFI
jgi:hypothetical protein